MKRYLPVLVALLGAVLVVLAFCLAVRSETIRPTLERADQPHWRIRAGSKVYVVPDSLGSQGLSWTMIRADSLAAEIDSLKADQIRLLEITEVLGRALRMLDEKDRILQEALKMQRERLDSLWGAAVVPGDVPGRRSM